MWGGGQKTGSLFRKFGLQMNTRGVVMCFKAAVPNSDANPTKYAHKSERVHRDMKGSDGNSQYNTAINK